VRVPRTPGTLLREIDFDIGTINENMHRDFAMRHCPSARQRQIVPPRFAGNSICAFRFSINFQHPRSLLLWAPGKGVDRPPPSALGGCEAKAVGLGAPAVRKGRGITNTLESSFFRLRGRRSGGSDQTHYKNIRFSTAQKVPRNLLRSVTR
jgi:hypothetical protein